MKIRENKNIKDKNSNKLKRQVSIITVFLWIFLVATMVVMVNVSIRNANALEENNIEIYEENSQLGESRDVRASSYKGTVTLYGTPIAAIKKGPLDYSKVRIDIGTRIGSSWSNVSYDIPQVDDYFTLNEGWTIDYVGVSGNISDQRQPGGNFPLGPNGGSMIYYFKQETEYTVKYTDSSGNETFFKDQIYNGLYEGDNTPEFKGTPFRKGYIFGGWYPAVNTIISPEDSDENNEIIYTATWQKVTSPSRTKLVDILGDFVNVHCVSNHTHEDKLYSILNNTEDIVIGEVYYSEEKQIYLCDIIVNGEEYAEKYSRDTDTRHYLVKDNDFSKPAIYDEDTKKTITLYYDVEAWAWKKLDDIELPIVFNVTCNLANVDGFYKVNHEYYLKDENGNMTLEGVYNLGAINVSFTYDEKIKVGVSSKEESVDIEIRKRPNYSINDIEYEYKYLDNSGNITLEPDITKEITLRYVREEVKIKAEKIWEDENNKYGKRPENVVLQIKTGEEIVSEMEVSEENNWSYEFVVPKYDKEGNEIEYVVDEKETDVNYEKRIDGYKVINKYRVEENNKNEENNNNDIIKNEENVDTSDINIWMYVGVAIVSIVVIVVVIVLVKKNNKK